MTENDLGVLPEPRERATLSVWPEVGRILGLSKASAYQAVERGEIPSIRLGRRVLVPTAALRRMLALDAQASPGQEDAELSQSGGAPDAA